MKARFSDRVIVVTGAGSGIGRAMALLFAAEGGKVLVADIVPARTEQTRAAISARGGTALGAVTDVRDEASVAAMIAAAMGAWGRVDVLCNNAGIMDMMQGAGELETDLWYDVMRTNLDGVMFGIRAVLPHMLEAGRGVIINTASGAAIRGGAAGAAYTASKHGVVGLTKNTAYTYRKNGIRCVAICPGAVATDIDRGKGLAAFDPAGLETLMPVLGLGNGIADPDDMANVALFLASDAAAVVNGSIISVDGAWSAG